jgi:DNA (cytosine-5)-methyltransferase 1
VGNAVSVPMAEWVGNRLADPSGDSPEGTLLKRGVTWPTAAWGRNEQVYAVDVSSWPLRMPATSLREFLRFPRSPLSLRAAAGFYGRAIDSCLRFEEGFLQDVKLHIDGMARSIAVSNGEKNKEAISAHP